MQFVFDCTLVLRYLKCSRCFSQSWCVPYVVSVWSVLLREMSGAMRNHQLPHQRQHWAGKHWLCCHRLTKGSCLMWIWCLYLFLRRCKCRKKKKISTIPIKNFILLLLKLAYCIIRIAKILNTIIANAGHYFYFYGIGTIGFSSGH